MATQDDLERLLGRTTRDLRAPMAMLTAWSPHHRVVADCGFENSGGRSMLLSAPADSPRSTTSEGHVSGIRAWARAAVVHDGDEVGALFVADRRRRWFDDEELRHLGLLTAAAGSFLAGPDLAIDATDQAWIGLDLGPDNDLVDVRTAALHSSLR